MASSVLELGGIGKVFGSGEGFGAGAVGVTGSTLTVGLDEISRRRGSAERTSTTTFPPSFPPLFHKIHHIQDELPQGIEVQFDCLFVLLFGVQTPLLLDTEA